MRSKSLLIIAAGLLGSVLACEAARAGVFISTTFLGTPRESNLPGARRMPGWGAAVATLVSTGGPILSVDYGGTAAGGEPYGIYAALGQRWTSSQSNGVYDVSSPGPMNVYNGQSDLSFDSHFIVTEGVDRVFTIAPSEGLVTFPGLNPIPSTPNVGYGHGLFPGSLTTTGYLRGKFDLPPASQLTEVPLAYLTFGGAVTFFGRVTTTDGSFQFTNIVLWQEVPEPGQGLALITFWPLLALRRNRRRARRATKCGAFLTGREGDRKRDRSISCNWLKWTCPAFPFEAESLALGWFKPFQFPPISQRFVPRLLFKVTVAARPVPVNAKMIRR